MKVITGNHYLAFVLTERQREYLLKKYMKHLYRHSIVECRHVTIAYDFKEEDIPLLQKVVDQTKHVELNGYIYGDGIDCFKVLIDGVARRPLSSLYHLTGSRSVCVESSTSNELLNGERMGFSMIEALDRLEGEFQLVPKDNDVNVRIPYFDHYMDSDPQL